jgi:REP element-mobilizing transposase RayT
MSKAYTELFYHFVWATWKRDPIIRPEIQEDLYTYIAHKCQAYGYELYAVNGMEDHVHVVLRVDPSVTIADVAGKLKGSASRFCNKALGFASKFQWQAGYAALTFSKRDLPKVVAYVQNQKARHREARLDNALEALAEE